MEYLVVDPKVGSLRNDTARRVLAMDEHAARCRVDADEVTQRIALMTQHVVFAARALQAVTAPKRRPDREWEARTLDAFEVAESEQVRAACKEYTPTGTAWMPHETLRQIYDEWKLFYAKWKRPHATASSLLSSLFCSVLVDDSIDEAAQVRLSKELVYACLEVTNDVEADAADACPYHTFVLLVKNIAELLFAPKHPYVATHLLAVVLLDRIHRAHE
jgi:hypothetical protein